MTSPSTNLISLPFSHLTCDLHDVKKILVQGDEPQKVERKMFILGVNGAILGVKNKKMKTKIGLLLTLFFKLVKQSYKLNGYRGDNLAILFLKILINY